MARAKPGPFVDTNVFFSALYSPLGPPAAILEAHIRGGSMINAADAPILAAAVRSGADCLVSGNTRHFTAEVGRKAGIEILTPTAYIAALHI